MRVAIATRVYWVFPWSVREDTSSVHARVRCVAAALEVSLRSLVNLTTINFSNRDNETPPSPEIRTAKNN